MSLDSIFKKVLRYMTKEEFKLRWESNDQGGGITFDDIAECAQQWGLFPCPRIFPIGLVRYRVLLNAGAVDAEEYNPANEDND